MIAARTSRGFTLIEALAAIAVMVIVIPILLQGFTMANAIAASARQTADATALGQSCLDECLATQVSRETVQQQVSGATVQQQQVNGTVYTVASQMDAYENEVDIAQLTVEVSWTARGQPRSISLTSLVFQPESTSQSTTPLGGGIGGGQP